MSELSLGQTNNIITFLLPGITVVLAIFIRFWQKKIFSQFEKLGFGELLIGLIIAFLIGIVSYRISAIIIFPLKFFLGNQEGILDGIVSKFPEFSLIKSSIATKLRGNLIPLLVITVTHILLF